MNDVTQGGQPFCYTNVQWGSEDCVPKNVKIYKQYLFQSRFQMAQKGPKNQTFLSGVQIMA